MKKEIYGKKLVKYPKHVADMELSIESFMREDAVKRLETLKGNFRFMRPKIIETELDEIIRILKKEN